MSTVRGVIFYPGCHWEVAHVVGSGNLHQGGHHSAGNWWGDKWYLMPALEDYAASQEAPSWGGGGASRLIPSFHTTLIYWVPVWAGTGLQSGAGAYLHDAYIQAQRTTGEKTAASPASRPVPVTQCQGVTEWITEHQSSISLSLEAVFWSAPLTGEEVEAQRGQTALRGQSGGFGSFKSWSS